MRLTSLENDIPFLLSVSYLSLSLSISFPTTLYESKWRTFFPSKAICDSIKRNDSEFVNTNLIKIHAAGMFDERMRWFGLTRRAFCEMNGPDGWWFKPRVVFGRNFLSPFPFNVIRHKSNRVNACWLYWWRRDTWLWPEKNHRNYDNNYHTFASHQLSHGLYRLFSIFLILSSSRPSFSVNYNNNKLYLLQ